MKRIGLKLPFFEPSIWPPPIWWKNLPTVNSAVRTRVRASWRCSQAAKPHFGKIVPTYKANYRLYFASTVDAKNVTEMPRKFPFKCFFVLEMLAQNVHISPQTLGKMGHQIRYFRSHFQKMKTIFMFRRWSFSLILKEFLKNSNPLQSYSHFSKLLPSKPPEHSARTCAARYSRQRA